MYTLVENCNMRDFADIAFPGKKNKKPLLLSADEAREHPTASYFVPLLI